MRLHLHVEVVFGLFLRIELAKISLTRRYVGPAVRMIAEAHTRPVFVAIDSVLVHGDGESNPLVPELCSKESLRVHIPIPV